MNKTLSVILACLILFFIIFSYTSPSGRVIWNRWFYQVHKADDATNYHTLKEIEDTCRAMIASYTSDMLTYNQYKNSSKTDEASWAAQAQMRANKTAASYNEYILKNSYVWAGNIPKDIRDNLDYIQ